MTGKKRKWKCVLNYCIVTAYEYDNWVAKRAPVQICWDAKEDGFNDKIILKKQLEFMYKNIDTASFVSILSVSTISCCDIWLEGQFHAVLLRHILWLQFDL